MKLLKAFLYVIFMLIALAVVIPVVLMIFVNPNQFKSQIQKEVSAALNRPFVIQGDLHWAVYPTVGIKAEGISMQGLLTVKTLEFSVALRPLLHKEVRIGKIVVDGLNLTLVKKANGQTNWENTGKPSSVPKSSQSSVNKSGDTAKIAAFSVSEIQIKNSQITFDDATQDKHIKITNFNFESTDVGVNQSFPVKLSMTAESNNLAGPVDVDWQANISYSPVQNKINMVNIHAALNNDLVLTGDENIVLGNTVKWHADINLNNINIQNLLKLFKKNSLKISGTGTLSANLSGAGSTSTLNGDMKFAVQNGIFYGIDLYYYGDVADSLSNKKAPTLSNTKQTPFGELTGTAKIQSGVFINNDLLIKASKVNATGQGTANLNTEQLDYRLSLQRMTSGAEAKPRGPAIPLTITGNFSSPSVKLDMTSLAVSEVKQQLADKVQQYAPQINQKIADGLQSLLGK